MEDEEFKRGPSAQTEEGEEARVADESVHDLSVSRSISPGLLQHTSSFVLSAIIRWNPIPTPSMTPRKTAHMMAEFRAALKPPRMAREPPVRKPALIAFQASSFFRTPLMAQSKATQPLVLRIGESIQAASETYSRIIHPKHQSYHLGRERAP